jgi:proteasome alpha subunit
MTEEPYRWLEAIGNRREYISEQMKGGTPVFALSRPEGILLLGVGIGQSKVFEIYDRHGFTALGHPVDIEKLRQAAIEAAHVSLGQGCDAPPPHQFRPQHHAQEQL